MKELYGYDYAKTCPLIYALTVVGARWKLPIVWYLTEEDGLHYNELRRRVQGITDTALARNLHELEDDGGRARGIRCEHGELEEAPVFFVPYRARRKRTRQTPLPVLVPFARVERRELLHLAFGERKIPHGEVLRDVRGIPAPRNGDVTAVFALF